MTVVQVTASYPPYHLGGTEVYLEGLVAELAQRGIASTVLAPRHPAAADAYMHGATPVETFPVGEAPTSSELKEFRPHEGFDRFLDALTRHRGAIYHQHAWTRGCGAFHLRAARELGMRTVLTVHVPGNTCLRGTMLRFGETVCDGRIDAAVCGTCWAQAKGLPRPVANAIGLLPAGLAQLAQRSHGRIATALAAREHAGGKLRHLAAMIADADRIVAVCRWLYDVLALNGVPRDKLVLCRHGLASDDLTALTASASLRKPHSGPLRILFLGRCDPVKGIDVVVRAVRAIPADIPFKLRICTVPAAAESQGYEQCVRALAMGDRRISFEETVPRSGLAEALTSSDVLVVPSTWLETGPLVVLEALAAGCYVLGSDRGGIAELITHKGDGELVAAGNVDAWTAAIADLAQRHSRGSLPRPSRPVRAMAAVAEEMAAVYGSL